MIEPAERNQRSCKNIEQASVFADAELYEFHRGWIEQLFTEAATCPTEQDIASADQDAWIEIARRTRSELEKQIPLMGAMKTRQPNRRRIMSDHSTQQVEYRPIEGFPGYRVGDDGTVWSSLKRRSNGIGFGTSVFIGEVWRKLKPQTGKSGRLFVCLCRPGFQIRRLIHCLVLESFVGPCPEGMESCHYPDSNPKNCRLDNLRWDTHKNNMRDRVFHGTDPVGSRNPSAKLNEEKVLEIRYRWSRGETAKSLAKEFGVSGTMIGKIVKREKWNHI